MPASPSAGLPYIAYEALGPKESRYSGVRLRIAAFRVLSHPDPGQLKVVVQSIDQGRPIAEDPLLVQWMTPLEIVSALSQSLRDGWDVFPAPEVALSTPSVEVCHDFGRTA